MIHNPSLEIRNVRPKIDQNFLENLPLYELANRNKMRIFKEFGVMNFGKLA